LLWCTSAVIASYLVTLLVGVPLVRRANASRAPLTAMRGLQRGLATGLAISLCFIIVLMLPHAFTAFNVILFLVLGGGSLPHRTAL
jgi:hypothetical protein